VTTEPAAIVAFVRARLDEDEQVASHVLRHSWDSYGRQVAEAWVAERVVADEGRVDCWQVRTDRGPATVTHHVLQTPWPGELTAQHVARFGSPRRVLREVVALRAILNLYEVADSREISADAWLMLGQAVRHLAAVWSDHPDYRPEWAVEAP
jgi:Family of unknown function (DUF6221)